MESVNIKLTVKEAELVLGALGNLPFNQVSNLISNIQKQATEQLTPPVTVVEESKAD
jgi:hypothetical protein